MSGIAYYAVFIAVGLVIGTLSWFVEERVMDSKLWAQIIISKATDEEISVVIGRINDATISGDVSRASVIVGCAQVLAQCIAGADADISQEVRAGIISLIDGFAMQVAVGETP